VASKINVEEKPDEYYSLINSAVKMLKLITGALEGEGRRKKCFSADVDYLEAGRGYA
jgi:hypothetical protein